MESTKQKNNDNTKKGKELTYNIENCIKNVTGIMNSAENRREFATMLGYGYSTFSSKINLTRPIDLVLALKVADYKGISLHDLVNNTENPSSKPVPYMVDFQNGTTIDYSNVTFQKIHDYWQEVKTDYYIGASRENAQNQNIHDENFRTSTTLYRYKNADKAYLKKNLRLDTYLELCNYLLDKGDYSYEDLL